MRDADQLHRANRFQYLRSDFIRPSSRERQDGIATPHPRDEIVSGAQAFGRTVGDDIRKGGEGSLILAVHIAAVGGTHAMDINPGAGIFGHNVVRKYSADE